MKPKILEIDVRSVDLLKAIFESAGYVCDFDDDGDLRIIDDAVVILQSRGDRSLRFVAMYRLTDEADEYHAREFESRINEYVDCVKARISFEFRILTLSWVVNSEGGITTENLVSTYRKFQRFVRSVEGFDDDDLLE